MMINIIDDADGFARLAPQWNELLQNSAADCPFLTAEWLGAWWRFLSSTHKLQLITVTEGGRLIAVAPLLLMRGPLGMFPRLEFLGTGPAGSDYLDVIVRYGHEGDGLQAIVAALEQQRATLRLNHVLSASAASRLAERLREDGWTLRITDGGLCPVIALAGHTWESYLASLGASHRANFRRRARSLNERFDVQFRLVTTDADRRDALTALVNFHAQRFGPHGSTAFLTPAVRAFQADATRQALERGWLRMYVLNLDGQPAGVMYGFLYNGRFYFYQHGFDPQHERFSVGLVLMGLTIQAALEEGAIEFDMLWGTETYKSLWARDQRQLAQVQAFPPHMAGIVQRRTLEAERTMRTVARRILAIGAARAS
jgi:CelD/BcsL family acetyltransferase involved in cellulose biosynthesis